MLTNSLRVMSHKSLSHAIPSRDGAEGKMAISVTTSHLRSHLSPYLLSFNSSNKDYVRGGGCYWIWKSQSELILVKYMK